MNIFTSVGLVLGIAFYMAFGLGVGVALSALITRPHEFGKRALLIASCLVGWVFAVVAIFGAVGAAALAKIATKVDPVSVRERSSTPRQE